MKRFAFLIFVPWLAACGAEVQTPAEEDASAMEASDLIPQGDDLDSDELMEAASAERQRIQTETSED